MRAFRALTLNTVRSGLRNRVALFFTLGLAVLFMVIFGELFGGNNFSITYGVVDADHSAQSQQFVSRARRTSRASPSSRARRTPR